MPVEFSRNRDCFPFSHRSWRPTTHDTQTSMSNPGVVAVVENQKVDPFALWLLGSAVAPDLYQRAINYVTSGDAEKRLGHHIRDDVGRFPVGPTRSGSTTTRRGVSSSLAVSCPTTR